MVKHMAKSLDIRSDLGRAVRVYLDAPCVCGARVPLRFCCFRQGTIAPRSVPSLTQPPGPRTSYSNQRCYAAVLRDCDDKMSNEHYFSRGVLRALAEGSPNNTVRARGLGHPDADLPPDRVAQSKILCRRHNSALCPIDTIGGRLFAAVSEALKLIPSYSCRLLTGLDVERWLLKVACGILAAGKRSVPSEWVNILFGRADLDPIRGLYMHVPAGETVRENAGVACGLFSRAGVPTGVDFAFDGVRFTLDMAGDRRTHRESDIGSIKVYRPIGVWFDHHESTSFHLGFEWGEQLAASQSVAINVVERRGSGD